MTNTLKRVCIYPKDIQRITGKSYRQSTRILQEIRIKLKKEKGHLVTIDEFCEHTNISEEQVSALIN